MNILLDKEREIVSFYGKACCLATFLLLIGFLTQVSATGSFSLQTDDCKKCHAFQLQMISQDGGKHATEIGCLNCHPQHPPNGKNTKEPCVLCHEGQAHFQVGDCLHCHTNPHKPLVSLRDSQKPERSTCLSCHVAVGQLMTAEPSRHAELFCNRCHRHHKEIPSCLDCHEAHLQNQTIADCLRCHPAHQPLKIVPAGYIPAAFCQSCHKKAANDLARTKTNHGGINCVYCHKGLHPSVPKCQDCHGLPHAQLLHSQYRKCLDCHSDAHRLISNQ